ncbi:MAG: LLM class flavin-dependent oxidoreductase [Candidatus Lokiarchaeota archaeon]|nr:LLM class flavin-dependent oxidoreductase [Candidatus Lokiarchaeota archaeon]
MPKNKFGIYIANYGITDDPQDYIDLAILSENNGWDGFFLWDHVYLSSNKTQPFLDPWIILSAIAAKTKRVKLGTTVTPLARRRPWIIAKEVSTLDRLSKGRIILGVGLGAGSEFSNFGENTDPIIRREKLDESLQIIKGLWANKRFTFKGKHFNIKEVEFFPKPYQEKIPIWVGGIWPNKKPFQRAAKYDGVFPIKISGDENLSPNDYREIVNYLKQYRSSFGSYDIIKSITSTGIKDEDEWINNYLDVGITWFVESMWPGRYSLDNFKKRIARGPPLIK